MEKIIQQKISADHLLYVSLKYTKTTDVMLNLIARWRSMIEIALDSLLEKAKKKKLIKTIPEAPKMKIDKTREIYKKDPIIIETLDLYEFFKRVDNLEKTRENEFRKHVTLKVLDKGEWFSIDMDKLKEFSEILERFIDNLRQIL
tara:strand:+ start:494 stop:928 length:435 start_codon:yes stop_codon:yes gene_type:complete